MITRENYEIYFIDFLEGNLSEEEIILVENFLENNPDLKEELELLDFESVNLKPTVSSTDFSFLKKEQAIDSENETNFFIGKLEGDLSAEEEKMLTLYLKENPEKINLYESFQQTKLTPVVHFYPGKKKLKKQPSRTLFFSLATSAAAAAIFAVIVFNFNTQETIYQASNFKNNWELNSPPIQNQIVKVEEVNTPKETTFVKPKSIDETPISSGPKPRTKSSLEAEQIPEIEINQPERGELMASYTPVKVPAPQKEREIQTTSSYTPREFVKEKTKDFVQEKTNKEVETGQDLFAFATEKVKENVIPKFVEVETKEVENQKYRTIKIGKKFSIKQKIKS